MVAALWSTAWYARARSRIGWLLLSLGLVSGLSGCGLFGTIPGPGRAGMGCSAPKVAPGERATLVKLNLGERVRQYYLYVPPGLDPSKPHPLLLSFHGLNTSAWDHLEMSGLNVTAEARGFMVAYPEGTEGSWNGGDCCGTAWRDGVDDVAFARAVVQDTSSRACVDTRRVYATGMANGAMLTHRLACEASDLVAAVAPIAGGLFLQDCRPSRPVSVLAINGTADEVMAFSIAESSYRSWQLFDQCRLGADTSQGRCSVNTECPGQARVGLCRLEDVGHCWPGTEECDAGRSTSPLDFSANVEMWRFFERIQLP